MSLLDLEAIVSPLGDRLLEGLSLDPDDEDVLVRFDPGPVAFRRDEKGRLVATLTAKTADGRELELAVREVTP